MKSQHWGYGHKLLMGGVDLDYLKTVNMVRDVN